MPRSWSRLVVVLSVASAMIGLSSPPVGAGAPDPAAVVEPAVAEALRTYGTADFFVQFVESADLTAASAIADWNERGAAVVAALHKTADASQADARGLLDRAGTGYQAFWASNTILVRAATAEVAGRLAGLDGVERITAPATYEAPAPVGPGTGQDTDAVEWGIAAIRADQVWSTFGVRGEGVVVANIDTGVDFDHPALVNQYRGNLGGGAFDHDHNWFDPSAVCPSAAPCDNNNHGTHTMGTAVGDDGAGNQIGAAPGARWIAAKGCESAACSQAALLASGQWMLAPTDTTGADPRPDLRPHVVNNSWGGPSGNQWFRDVVVAWRAAGIVPVFSASGSGPTCGTVGSPADYPESYATGAFDINGNIAGFSGRGPAGAITKPDIAAPGVLVRSAVKGGGYLTFSGTSMAVPHTGGTVALVLSAAPSLVGDVPQTLDILDGTAIDVSDLTCGGTADDNNVWGEGKLDALAAVTAAPRGPTGVLTGTVSRVVDGAPIAGATVTVTGPAERQLVTGADGGYSATLPVGEYRITAAGFGLRPFSATVTVTEGATVEQDLRLVPAPHFRVEGVVRGHAGQPLTGATVTVPGTPLTPLVTGPDGSYVFGDVPLGSYRVVAGADRCHLTVTTELTVDRTSRLDFDLPARADPFGNICIVEGPGYVEGDTPLALTGDDTSAGVALPFAFPFYGATYTQAFVSSNGHLNFQAPSTAFNNVSIPSAGAPNAAVYAFWDDLVLDAGSAVFTRTTAGSFTVEWRNATFFGASTFRVDFEVELFADGQLAIRYRNLDPTRPRELGSSATVGIENATGTVALQYAFGTPALSDTVSVRFRLRGRSEGSAPTATLAAAINRKQRVMMHALG